MAELLKEERQPRILDLLQENNKVTVSEMSQHFGISEVTIRRDLRELVLSGKLRRAHRGALLTPSAPAEQPVQQRLAQDAEEKDRIARCAVELIKEGECIFIGSGSTMSFLARYLDRFKNLTVVTNALNIAVDLAAQSQLTVVMTGGVLSPSELSVLGHITDLTLNEIHLDKVFMGMQAISLEGGLTSEHFSEVVSARNVIAAGPELIVLAGHNKLGKTAAAFICPLQSMTTLVTGREIEPDLLETFTSTGVRVMLA